MIGMEMNWAQNNRKNVEQKIPLFRRTCPFWGRHAFADLQPDNVSADSENGGGANHVDDEKDGGANDGCANDGGANDGDEMAVNLRRYARRRRELEIFFCWELNQRGISLCKVYCELLKKYW